MNNPTIPPITELWRQPVRRNWLWFWMPTVVGTAGVALIWAGIDIHCMGQERLGVGIAALDAVVFLLSALGDA